MLSPQALVKGIVARIRPASRNLDNTNIDVASRFDPYGGSYASSIVPSKHLLSEEGSYFTANNGQTGQISAATTPAAFVATTPWLIIYNNSPVGLPSSPSIFLDYALFGVSVQGATMTSVQMAVVRDTINRFSALGAGGVSLTPNKTNSAGPGSMAIISAGGQMTALAASNTAATLVGNRIIRTAAAPASVTGDEYMLQFGSVDGVFTQTPVAAQPGKFVESAPPFVINPGESGLIYIWFPAIATTGVTLLPEIGWWER